ncbi:tetratricopeptide repeat protein [Tautonia sociabilis]|uniref:Tetratricopeptide repeat protein n=1 Tax=Tautonia sociabilis TaxID=2080755 RepID=A0A432MDW8_9BACT|nr:tetratricopeptide repeat protein [Tautonia sociabilis]RUL83185.1 tetratricopeptide repeat protein [Tautonia sociabilis]
MPDADHLTRRCLELLEEGHPEVAEALVSGALRSDPEDGTLQQLRGLLRRERGDLDAALADLEAASAVVPLNPAARCALADCYVAAEKPELARLLYRDLAEHPGCPTALLPPVAAGLGAVGEFSLALSTCRELARRDPTAHQAYFGIAFYLRRLGHPVEDVLDPVRRAFELAPGSTLYRVTLSALLDHVGRRREAIELMRDVDPASVGCSCCLHRVATLFRQAGDDTRAERWTAAG